MKILYTKHAQESLSLRKITKRLVKQCIEKPDKVSAARENKEMFLKDFGKNYLKVIISQENNTYVVITVYWLAKKRIKA